MDFVVLSMMTAELQLTRNVDLRWYLGVDYVVRRSIDFAKQTVIEKFTVQNNNWCVMNRDFVPLLIAVEDEELGCLKEHKFISGRMDHEFPNIPRNFVSCGKMCRSGIIIIEFEFPRP